MTAFVILHYQAIDETNHCIDSIKKNVHDEKIILVVDNNSPNGTGKDLKIKYEKDEQVRIIQSKSNLGFAKGNNLGYKEARKYNPSFIVVLNNDTSIEQSNFSELLDKAYKKYFFDVMGPDIYSTKTFSHQNPQRQRNFSLTDLKRQRRHLIIKNKFKFLIRLKYIFIRNHLQKNVHRPRDFDKLQIGPVLHGAFYIYSKKFIDKHEECFYSETFMYYESYILHYLCMKEKMIFLYYPEIKVVHHEDISTDMTYTTQYHKSVFTNQHLLESCEIFIRIMENNSAVIN